jgi:anti-sigma B factor antagonist
MTDTSLAITRSDGAREGERIIRLQGPLTLSTCPPFQSAVKEESGTTLLVDLTEVPYVDSAGLGSLVGALVTLQRANKRLALVGPNQRVRALIQMSNLMSVFPTFPTIEEAQGGLS